MHRDPKAAELLSRLQKNLGTTQLVNEINRNASNLDSRYTRSHLHYWTQLKRPIPGEIVTWLQKEAFIRLTPWGSYAFLGKKAPWLEIVLDALRKPEPDLNAALDLVLRLEKAGDNIPERPLSADTWPSLSALVGTILRVKGLLPDARRAFERAVDLAEKYAPELLPRYRTNLLNIGREVRFEDFKHKLISPEAYRGYLKAILAKQREVLGQAQLESDRTLALKHCLRLTSLLDDRREFSYFLCEARKCKGFGPSPEDRDRALVRFMNAEHDEDRDFENAREYRCFTELVTND